MINSEKYSIFVVTLILIGALYPILPLDVELGIFHVNGATSDDDSIIHSSSRAIIDDLTILAEGIGNEAGSGYGNSLAGAGDLNGDGFDDIIIGAPLASPVTKNGAGEVYIFYGSEDFALKKLNTGSADVTIRGTETDENAGWSLCIPGDINGDNKDDLLIGAPGTDSDTGSIFGFYSSTITSASMHQLDSADITISGPAAGYRFGYTIISLGDVNSDSEVDIMVGAPGGDIAYLMYGPTYGTSDRTVIQGPPNTEFGTAVYGGTDLNNDGSSDYVVGAPIGTASSNYKGQVFIYFGYDGIYDMDTIATSNNTLTGSIDGDLFGQSLNSGIDIDTDGFFDIIVGAPGEDTVYIYYGKTLIEKYLYPYLWNMPADSRMPVDFSSGVYNDVGTNQDINTYGLGNGDDGWDWGPNVFGTSSGSDMDHLYGAWEESSPPYADAEGVDYGNQSRLEVLVGRTNTAPGPTIGWWSTGADSGAWGIEFQISPSMYNNITAGAEIFLELDWEAHDSMKVFSVSGGTEESCYVKMRLTSPTTATFLGTNIGGDPDPELFYWASGSSMNGPFNSVIAHYKNDITDLITDSGSYYFEMGARMEKTEWFTSKDASEGIVAYFDNIAIYIETLPITHSVKVKGVSQSQFGLSLGIISDQNSDGHKEIGIGAPYSNLGALNSGAIYIVYGDSDLRPLISSSEAQRIITIPDEEANAGTFFTDAGNVNGDAYNELLVGAPGHQNDQGRVMVFSPARIPQITMIYPQGGITASGELELKAEASDWEDELDKFGVGFYYGAVDDGKVTDWIGIATVTTPSARTTADSRSGTVLEYTMDWDSTTFPDGFYKIRAVVTDNTYLSAEAVSDTFEVDNPDPPIIEILEPSLPGKTYSGTVGISAKCTDPDFNLNSSSFYFSTDQLAWTFIGIDYESENDVYSLKWETEDLVDGEYYIRVEANDTSGLSTEALSVKFNVYNPGPPFLEFLNPRLNDTLKGFVMLKVSFWDKDDNLAESGIEFYYSINRNTWSFIGSTAVGNADGSYSVHWNTVKVPDGNYWLRAFALDTTNLSGEAILGPLRVDNPSPPSIILKALSSPLSGTVRLKATTFDDDSPISSDGVTFFASVENDTWTQIGQVKIALKGIGEHKSLYELDWDTTKDQLPDSNNYMIKATVKDSTGLTNETVIGPYVINNPDPPNVRLENPQNGEKISKTVTIGAYVDDPDGDIDDRGVIFYFSRDGKKWYLIDNVATPSPGSTLYQLEWDTTRLPDGNYDIKAEVVDETALKSVSTVIVEIDNEAGISFSGLSSSVIISMLVFIVIIIILVIFLFMMILKRRKEKKEQEKIDERKELAKEIREEILKERIQMYPSMTGQPIAMPALPPYAHTPSPYSDAAAASDYGERPLLPAYQGPEDAAGSGPYTGTDTGVRVTIPEEQSYQTRVGLTPEEVAKIKIEEGKEAASPTPAPVKQQVQTQAPAGTAAKAPGRPPVPAPQPAPTPSPQPAPAEKDDARVEGRVIQPVKGPSKDGDSQ